MTNINDKAELLKANAHALFIPGALLMKYGPEDYIGAALAVRGTLYFDGSHTPEVRSAICECFAAYEAIAKEHLKWLWREAPPSGPDKFAFQKAPAMPTMMAKLRPDDLVSFAYTGGAKPEDASPWMFHVHGVRAWQAKMGGDWGLATLTFSLPPQYVEENPLALQKLFRTFATAVKAVHGYAGFAFNLSVVREEPNEPTEAFMSTTMNGIDVGSPVNMGSQAKYGILDHLKTVGWLTAINKEMLEKVGGLATLRSELPASWFAKYEYENGIVIQAGPKPEIIPIEIDPKPATYVLPNMALASIRMFKIDSFHYGSKDGEPRLRGLAADEWLHRFDVSDDELMTYKSKLLKEPKLSNETALPDSI